MKAAEYSITLSAEPDARMNSLYGLNDKQLTSAVCASTAWLGLEVLFERVSQLKGGGLKKTIFSWTVEMEDTKTFPSEPFPLFGRFRLQLLTS